MPVELRGENLEKAFSWVFRVWPFAMLFAPAVGGWVANLWSIRADLWIGVVAYLLAMIIFLFTKRKKTYLTRWLIRYDGLACQ